MQLPLLALTGHVTTGKRALNYLGRPSVSYVSIIHIHGHSHALSRHLDVDCWLPS